MDEAFFTLTGEEHENLLRAIETSLQVKKRHQFFLWTQGALQAFVPHKILIGLVTLDGKEFLVLDRFNSCVVSDEAFEEACHPVEGVVMRAVNAWREAGDTPLLIAPGAQMPAALYKQFRCQLERISFGHAAGHGCAPVDGTAATAAGPGGSRRSAPGRWPLCWRHGPKGRAGAPPRCRRCCWPGRR